jgi:hypothetical protein
MENSFTYLANPLFILFIEDVSSTKESTKEQFEKDDHAELISSLLCYFTDQEILIIKNIGISFIISTKKTEDILNIINKLYVYHQTNSTVAIGLHVISYDFDSLKKEGDELYKAIEEKVTVLIDRDNNEKMKEQLDRLKNQVCLDVLSDDLIFAKNLLTTTNKPLFIISKHVILTLASSLVFDIEYQELENYKIISKINKVLELEKKAMFRLSHSIPVIHLNHKIVTSVHEPEYICAIIPADKNENIETQKMIFREQKRHEMFYLISPRPENEDQNLGYIWRNYFEKILIKGCQPNNRISVTKDINYANTGKKEKYEFKALFPTVNHFFDDMVFYIYGGIYIDFNSKLNLSSFPEKIKFLPLQDAFAQLVKTSSGSEEIIKVIDELIELNRTTFWNYKTGKCPTFCVFSSFPNSLSESKYRDYLSSNSVPAYVRSEGIWMNSLYNSAESNPYLQKYPPFDNFLSREEIVSSEVKRFYEIFKRNNLYENFSESKANKYYEDNKFKGKDDFILIVFSLEKDLISEVSSYQSIFYQNQVFQRIKERSHERFYILSVGILRGTWDGFMILQIKREMTLKEFILKLFYHKYHGNEDFIGKVISKMEIFIMKNLFSDDNISRNVRYKETIDEMNQKRALERSQLEKKKERQNNQLSEKDRNRLNELQKTEIVY